MKVNNVFGKKLMCIGLCLAIVLSMIPITGVVKAAANINNVEVSGIIPPSVGQTPSYAATVDGEGYILDYEETEYTCDGVTWYCNDAPMTPHDWFYAGNDYTVKVELLAENDNYRFDLQSAEINGQAAYIVYASEKYISIEYNFGTLTSTPVTSIEIDIEEIPSETADFIIPSLYKVNGSSGQLDIITDWYVGWAVNDTNTGDFNDYEFCYPEGEGFQAGKAYALYIEAGAADGYTFNKTTSLKLSSPYIEYLGTIESISSDGKNISFWFFFSAVEKHVHNYQKEIQKATLSANGKTYEICHGCGKIKNQKTIYKIKDVKLSAVTYTYNGKSKKPTVTVTDSKGNKITSKNYTVSYATGRTKVGKYKVTVKFKGNFSGTKTLYFKINPPKTTVSKLTAGKKSIKVSVSKKTTQVTGYEIQYSTSKKFTGSTTKTYTIKNYKTTSATLKNLKAKKTYYVRVRTYKTVSGVKYYSGWSGYKSKTTK